VALMFNCAGSFAIIGDVNRKERSQRRKSSHPAIC
jgi:hypothetical protein